METLEKNTITVVATIDQPVERVWEYWTKPEHITGWCAFSGDWHAQSAENDLRTGGHFKTRMAARDGSSAFDFGGVYTSVEPYRSLEYTIDDGRKVQVTFTRQGNRTTMTETFETEEFNPVEVQRGGWQAILDNFNAFVESLRDV